MRLASNKAAGLDDLATFCNYKIQRSSLEDDIWHRATGGIKWISVDFEVLLICCYAFSIVLHYAPDSVSICSHPSSYLLGYEHTLVVLRTGIIED